MYAKTKELGPMGGVRRARPPRSANAWYQNCLKYPSVKPGKNGQPNQTVNLINVWKIIWKSIVNDKVMFKYEAVKITAF